jgi:hypothetical protein
VRARVDPLGPVLERVPVVAGLCHRLLLDAEADGETVEQLVGAYRVGDGETLPGERGQPGLLTAEQGGVGEVGAADHLGAVAVGQQGPPGDGGERGHALVPGQVLLERGQGGADLPPDLGRHLVEKILLAADVPVQRGRLHSQSGRHDPHRQPVEPGLVEGLQSRRHDGRLRQSTRHG